MKKRIYRAEEFRKVNIELLSESVKNEDMVFSVDVAKEIFFGAFMGRNQQVIKTIKWRSPTHAREVVSLLKGLPTSDLAVAMEPSGTYGDAFRALLLEKDIPVYLVGAKRSHDACEIYDGVPSSHDAKSAAVIGKLYWDGMSRPWKGKNDAQRNLAAAVETVTLFQDQLTRNINRLESRLARYWPEVFYLLDLDSATLLNVLEQYGSPLKVVENEQAARQLMRQIGHSLLSAEKIDEVVESAKQTIGEKMLNGERQALMHLAMETNRNRTAVQKHKNIVRRLTTTNKTVSGLAEVVGQITAAVLYVYLGDPNEYSSAAAYMKAAGLNLKERSSGKHKGQLKISKRGSGLARKYLYLAVLRLIFCDKIFKAWYLKKVIRDGGKLKRKAIIALMRKLTAALWHVGKGETFDSKKLFNLKRLGLDELMKKAS